MNTFLRAYIEAALWSSTDNATDDGGEPLDRNYTAADLAPETLAKMQADCAAFERDAGAAIYGHEGDAGHDFWLTRNGHGAGYWDGGWTESAGTDLTALSERFGECDLYVGDDGNLYLSP